MAEKVTSPVVCVPVPVLGVGVGLEAIAADVEPDGGVEGDLLVEQEVAELGVEGVGVSVMAKKPSRMTPVADGFGDAGDEGADAGFALGGADEAVEVFGGDDVGRGHGPVGGHFDVLLLEDELALPVLDDGVAELPGDLVVGAEAGLGEEAAEVEARCGSAGAGGCLRGGGGLEGVVRGGHGVSSSEKVLPK